MVNTPSLEFKNDVCEFYKTHTCEDTMKFFGVSQSSIVRWAKKYGVWKGVGSPGVPRKKRPRIEKSEELKRDVCEFYKDNTLAETVAFFAISRGTVTRWARKAGIEKERGCPAGTMLQYPEDLKFEIIEYAEKFSMKEAAEKYNASAASIYTWRYNFKRYGTLHVPRKGKV